ncbi:hypothetical protein ACTNEN_11280, partial [Oribacterium sp. HCP28S3_H8]|uniref:hypothetical protein n=1 Tax=Oribacterium sp. HCP28S3_H8 TaxID=3438945 RepID=UPI003F888BBA
GLCIIRSLIFKVPFCSRLFRDSLYILAGSFETVKQFFEGFFESLELIAVAVIRSFILYSLDPYDFCVRRLANSSKLPPGRITVKQFFMFCEFT